MRLQCFRKIIIRTQDDDGWHLASKKTSLLDGRWYSVGCSKEPCTSVKKHIIMYWLDAVRTVLSFGREEHDCCKSKRKKKGEIVH